MSFRHSVRVRRGKVCESLFPLYWLQECPRNQSGRDKDSERNLSGIMRRGCWMNADLLNLDSASCPRPSGRQVFGTSWQAKKKRGEEFFFFFFGGGGWQLGQKQPPPPPPSPALVKFTLFDSHFAHILSHAEKIIYYFYIMIYWKCTKNKYMAMNKGSISHYTCDTLGITIRKALDLLLLTQTWCNLRTLPKVVLRCVVSKVSVK